MVRVTKEEKEEIVLETEEQKNRAQLIGELASFLSKSEGYMVSVTILKDGKLNHHLIRQSFPDIDILKSINEVEKIAVEYLKTI